MHSIHDKLKQMLGLINHIARRIPQCEELRVLSLEFMDLWADARPNGGTIIDPNKSAN
jgi:hypothetical protein